MKSKRRFFAIVPFLVTMSICPARCRLLIYRQTILSLARFGLLPGDRKNTILIALQENFRSLSSRTEGLLRSPCRSPKWDRLPLRFLCITIA